MPCPAVCGRLYVWLLCLSSIAQLLAPVESASRTTSVSAAVARHSILAESVNSPLAPVQHPAASSPPIRRPVDHCQTAVPVPTIQAAVQDQISLIAKRQAADGIADRIAAQLFVIPVAFHVISTGNKTLPGTALEHTIYHRPQHQETRFASGLPTVQGLRRHKATYLTLGSLHRLLS